MSYPGGDKTTSVNTVLVNGRLVKITAAMMVASIRSAASTLGRDRLGYDPESFGPAAMAMHLGACSTYAVMITGRWKSTALMEYIQDEIAQFSNEFPLHSPPSTPSSSRNKSIPSTPLKPTLAVTPLGSSTKCSDSFWPRKDTPH
jgi:hypothetical protein